MHDITDNPHLQMYLRGKTDFSLNSYLFNEYVLEKHVTRSVLTDSVRNLLLKLCFDIQLVGCKYLARLVAAYYVESDYDMARTLDALTKQYGTDKAFIYASIEEAVAKNEKFTAKAAHLLNCNAESIQCKCISDAVEITAAIFKIYYNYIVDDEYDDEKDAVSLLDIKRMILNGK